MHIPPYHKKVTWQRFFVGVMVGGVVAYCTLLYMYGSMYESLIAQNNAFRSEITELRNQNDSLLEDNDDLSERPSEEITVESINLTIENMEELRLDRLIADKLKELVQQELKHVVGKDLSIIGESDQLLESTVENKSFEVEEFTYTLTITKLIISKNIKITAKAERTT
ncbi:sporulation membrane protein YtrI [Virgibacillus salexigens]|uniref:sporulation membrane protein YtrI n=1 Tax=Virgibacillus salexigens TaxID=61016 RepID=UPI00190AC9BC|nr:sporulation membrane protein YtrI [Virgibacillus salexigens]